MIPRYYCYWSDNVSDDALEANIRTWIEEARERYRRDEQLEHYPKHARLHSAFKFNDRVQTIIEVVF